MHRKAKRCFILILLLIMELVGVFDNLQFSGFHINSVNRVASAKLKSGTTGEDIVKYALKFVGNPYIYGGTSLTKGIDCSGFTQAVYAHFGVSLPRSSTSQKTMKGFKNVKSPRAGDIVCYRKNHVAICTGNGNEIVHASNPKDGIKITKDFNYDPIYAIKRYKGMKFSGEKVNNNSSSSSSSTTEAPSGDDPTQTKEAKKLIKELGIKQKIGELKAAWNAFVADGYSDAAIAGIFGNSYQESKFNGASTDGTYLGILQWSKGSMGKALAKKSKKCGHTLKDVSGIKICTKPSCQFAFAMQTMKGKRPNWISTWMKNYNKYVGDFKGKKQGDFVAGRLKPDPQKLRWKVSDIAELKKFKKAKDAWDAGVSFFDGYERGTGVFYLVDKSKYSSNNYKTYFVFEHTVRPAYAEKFYKIFHGYNSDGSDSGATSTVQNDADKDAVADIANSMAKGSWWSEDKFTSYCKMNEVELKFPDADSISDEELDVISDWLDDIEGEAWYMKVASGMRYAVMLMGILLIVWVILLYLAFWFDTVNNFIDIELLLIFSFGRLKRAPNPKDCDFNIKSLLKGDAKTINIKYMTIVFLLGILVAMLIVTGKFFSLINLILGVAKHAINSISIEDFMNIFDKK